MSLWVMCGDEGSLVMIGPLFFREDAEWEAAIGDCDHEHRIVDVDPPDDTHIQLLCPALYVLIKHGDGCGQTVPFPDSGPWIIGMAYMRVRWAEQAEAWKICALTRGQAIWTRYVSGVYAPLPRRPWET